MKEFTKTTYHQDGRVEFETCDPMEMPEWVLKEAAEPLSNSNEPRTWYIGTNAPDVDPGTPIKLAEVDPVYRKPIPANIADVIADMFDPARELYSKEMMNILRGKS